MSSTTLYWDDPRDDHVLMSPVPSVGAGIEEAQELLEAGRVKRVWVRDPKGHVVWQRNP